VPSATTESDRLPDDVLGDLVGRRSSGSTFPLEVSVTAVNTPEERGDPKESPPRFFIAAIRDMTGVREAEREIERLAYTDVLTGLANRRTFLAHLESASWRLRRTGECFAVHFYDVDRFKFVNDSVGHTFGDALLAEMARRLVESTREMDVVARIGGDEFAVIQSALQDPGQATTLAEKVLRSVSEPVRNRGRELSATVTAGITVASADDNDPAHLMEQADIALHHAKATARSSWELYTPDLGARVSREIRTATQLEIALREREFFLLTSPRSSFDPGEFWASRHWCAGTTPSRASSRRGSSSASRRTTARCESSEPRSSALQSSRPHAGATRGCPAATSPSICLHSR
jgi:diguanylate cyclase (GGDEF)-like protein